MNRHTRLIILAALLLAPWVSDARTVAINVRPEQTNSVSVEHVQYTPLTLEMTVLGVVSTSATWVVRNASNVVVIATNATCNGDTYTAVTFAGNWTDETTGVLAPGDEPAQLWADLHLAGYGVPLRPIDIRVRYAAATGTETYVDPVTGAWTIGGTNRTDIQRVVVPAGSTVAAGVLTLASATTDAVTNGYHGGMSGTGSVTRVGNRLRIIMPAPGTTTNALTLEGHPAAYFRPAGQIENHAGASNLAWTASGHTGTPARIAGFLEGGSAGYIGFGPGLYLDGSDNIAVSNAVLNGAAQFGLWLASPTLPYTAITNAPWLTAVSIGAGLTGNGTPGNPLVATGGGVTNHQDLSNIPGDPEGYHLSESNLLRLAAMFYGTYFNTNNVRGSHVSLDTIYDEDGVARIAVLDGNLFDWDYALSVHWQERYLGRAGSGAAVFSWANGPQFPSLTTDGFLRLTGSTGAVSVVEAANMLALLGGQPTNANLTAWAAITPASKQDANTNLTTLAAGTATPILGSTSTKAAAGDHVHEVARTVVTYAASATGTNTPTLGWGTNYYVRVLSTNSAFVLKYDWPAMNTNYCRFLIVDHYNPNGRSVSYADTTRWCSNGAYTTTAMALGTNSAVHIRNRGAAYVAIREATVSGAEM